MVDEKDKRRPGRPRTDSRGQVIRIAIYLTPTTHAEAEEAAREDGYPSVATWVREQVARALKGRKRRAR